MSTTENTTSPKENTRGGKGGPRNNDSRGGNPRGNDSRGGPRGQNKGGAAGTNEEGNDLIDRLVAINRTTKVVKGGRRFGFSALVVVGDGKGRVGFGKGKAKEVADAKRKATDAAKKSMIKVPLREGRTFHHDIRATSGAGGVYLRAATPGTGIIAGGPMRAIFEALGVKDVVAKSFGSSNPYNMVASTFEALKNVQSPKLTAARRGKKINEIVSQRENIKGGSAEAAAAE